MKPSFIGRLLLRKCGRVGSFVGSRWTRGTLSGSQLGSSDQLGYVGMFSEGLQIVVHKNALGTVKAILLSVDEAMNRDDSGCLMECPVMSGMQGFGSKIFATGSARIL
jgi:hypothetical protein